MGEIIGVDSSPLSFGLWTYHSINVPISSPHLSPTSCACLNTKRLWKSLGYKYIETQILPEKRKEKQRLFPCHKNSPTSQTIITIHAQMPKLYIKNRTMQKPTSRLSLDRYPPVIKHGNRRYTTYMRFSYWNPHSLGIFQPAVYDRQKVTPTIVMTTNPWVYRYYIVIVHPQLDNYSCNHKPNTLSSII